MSALEIQNIRKTYGQVETLRASISHLRVANSLCCSALPAAASPHC